MKIHDDLGQPFVLNFEIQLDVPDDEKSFRIVFSFRIIMGRVDKQRHFHPFAVAIVTFEKNTDFSFFFDTVKVNKYIKKFTPIKFTTLLTN